MVKITSKHFISIFAVWCVATYTLFAVAALGSGDAKMRAMLGMVSGLLLLWVVIGGSIMYVLRDRVKIFVGRIPCDWRLKFIGFCTVLALVEEAVTTTMTNLAPLFGVKMGEVAITASANYIEVVTQHSVIVFVPMFVAWALLLWRYRFSPGSVFILWGLTGVLAETISFGLQNLLMTGFWVFVYGLMAWLPAYSVPERCNARPPKWYHYPMAVVVPIALLVPLFIIAAMLIAIITHL
jgi:hypothetical protein